MDARLPDAFCDSVMSLLPPQALPARQGGRPAIKHAVVLKVIWFVLTVGCRWKDIPPEFGCSGRNCATSPEAMAGTRRVAQSSLGTVECRRCWRIPLMRLEPVRTVGPRDEIRCLERSDQSAECWNACRHSAFKQFQSYVSEPDLGTFNRFLISCSPFRDKPSREAISTSVASGDDTCRTYIL